MKAKYLLVSILLCMPTVAAGQPQTDKPVFNFGFEKITDKAKLPDQWMEWGSGYILKTDTTEKRTGGAAVLIESPPEKKGGTFGSVGYAIPAQYEGKEIELRGFLKLKDVSEGFGGLLLRLDGESGTLQFDNMRSRNLAGSADWTQYSIKLPLPADASKIFVGALLTGKGQLWVDDLEVLIDGKDIREAKTRPTIVYKANLDKEFDTGSKVGTITLSKSKIADLDVLGRVWGFLKYHHPAIATGERNWDYELFRILPKILAAKNRDERNEILSAWTESLGSFETANAAKIDPATIKLTPDLSWINDKALGRRLTEQLNSIRNAKRPEKHFYIGSFPNVGNPEFKNENAYKEMINPDVGYRLLSLYRYWNIVQYFFPNRHLTDEKWADVLADFIPRFVRAENALDYRLAALALIESVEDTHANIWGRDEVMMKYRGLNSGPVEVTFIEGKAVVTGVWNEALAEKSGLKKGDVIETLNGEKVSSIVKRKLDMTPASNYPTKLRDIARYLFSTNEPSLKITYDRDGSTKEAQIETYPNDKFYEDMRAFYAKIPAFKLVRPDIGFLYPGSLKPDEITGLIPEIAKTRGLIVDLRSYPSDFIVFSLGNYLVPKPTKFVKFSTPDIGSPGLFAFTKELEVGNSSSAPYRGKLVILINETTQSQAEYTTMAFRTAPGATVIGSTTAGADGNVSRISLPGGINTMISGIGVYYPNGKETQRIGIVPDLVVKPTIRGIKDGRDELLDKAIEIINGN